MINAPKEVALPRLHNPELVFCVKVNVSETTPQLVSISGYVIGFGHKFSKEFVSRMAHKPAALSI